MLVFKQFCCCEAELVPELLSSLVLSPRALCNLCWPLAFPWASRRAEQWWLDPRQLLDAAALITAQPGVGKLVLSVDCIPTCRCSLQLFPPLQWKGQCPTLLHQGRCSVKLFRLTKPRRLNMFSCNSVLMTRAVGT